MKNCARRMAPAFPEDGMTRYVAETGKAALGEARPPELSCLAADSSKNNPALRITQAASRARRQRLVAHLHRLGPAPLFTLLPDRGGRARRHDAQNLR